MRPEAAWSREIRVILLAALLLLTFCYVEWEDTQVLGDHLLHMNATDIIQEQSTRENPPKSIQLDILSIGSVLRPDLQQAQRETFGRYARNFVAINETIDSETTCSTQLSKADAFGIAQFCKSSTFSQHAALEKMTVHFATRKWLAKKKNPTGWMCAQKRPLDALVAYVHQYRNDWPDYLAVVDDDSYLQVPAVLKELSLQPPGARAGCMIRSRLYEQNFTHPFGGYGLFLHQSALESLVLPIHCKDESIESEDHHRDDFNTLACWRLQQDSLGERNLFRNGMSVLELMQTYSLQSPYLQHQQWKDTGYCLHSDWMWGYILNFYPVIPHTQDVAFAQVPQDRLQGYRGSTIYAGKQTKQVIAERKECDNKGDACNKDSHVCHYATPEHMKALFAEQSK